MITRRDVVRGALAGAVVAVAGDAGALGSLAGVGMTRGVGGDAGASRSLAGLGMTRGAIRLDANENPYGPSPAAKRAMAEAIAEGNRYAEEADVRALREALAVRERVTPDHIVLGAGSTEILVVTSLAFLRGGALATSERTFGVVPAWAERLGTRVDRAPVTEAQALDLDGIAGRIGAETKLVYVVNPNNPTGTIVDGGALRSFCDAASRRAPVLVDEAYLDYLEPARQRSMVELVREGRDVIVSRTFSKIHGLAGVRMGYAVAPPRLAQRLADHRTGIVSNIAVAAARASLGDSAFVEMSRRNNAATRTRLRAGLRERGFASADSETNFVWFRLGERTDVPQKLAERGILIPTSRTALQGGWARVTVGRPEEIEAFLTAIR